MLVGFFIGVLYKLSSPSFLYLRARRYKKLEITYNKYYQRQGDNL